MRSVPPAPKVYPRVCGGTAGLVYLPDGAGGLSPRVRGNRVGLLVFLQRGGSIPACAGEPPVLACAPAVVRVYPRVCGGTGCGGRGAVIS